MHHHRGFSIGKAQQETGFLESSNAHVMSSSKALADLDTAIM